MKRTFSFMLLVISCLVLLFSIVFCIYSIVDITRLLNDLANNPGASGIDYFGIGWGYGVVLFVCSVFGFILSCIDRKLLRQKALRSASVIGMILFALLFIASLFLFYM